MKENNNVQIVVDNDCVILSNGSFMDAIQNIWELYKPGYFDIDIKDFDLVLGGSRCAVITTAIGEGPARMSDAMNCISKTYSGIRKSSILKDYGNTSEKLIFFKVLCSKHAERPVMSEELKEINKFTSTLPKSIKVMWSIGDDPSMGEKVKIISLSSFHLPHPIKHLY